MGAIGKLFQHLALVIGRKLIEEMTDIARRRAAGPAHRLHFGQFLGSTLSDGRLRRGEFGEYLRCSFSLTGVEPGAAQRITRGVKRRLELQCALKLGDGGRQVTHRKQTFAESEGRFGDAGAQRRRVAQSLQGLFVVSHCQQRAPEGNSGEQPAAAGLQLRLQDLSGAACIACRDPRIRLAQRIVICAGIHLGINARAGADRAS